jgi:hypothetical protein
VRTAAAGGGAGRAGGGTGSGAGDAGSARAGAGSAGVAGGRGGVKRPPVESSAVTATAVDRQARSDGGRLLGGGTRFPVAAGLHATRRAADGHARVLRARLASEEGLVVHLAERVVACASARGARPTLGATLALGGRRLHARCEVCAKAQKVCTKVCAFHQSLRTSRSDTCRFSLLYILNDR